MAQCVDQKRRGIILKYFCVVCGAVYVVVVERH